MRWTQGEATVTQLLTERRLERLRGAAANGEPWIAKARKTLDSARTLVDRDPESAYATAYDAARQATWGLLAHQGLRATSIGGHKAAEDVIRAQFGNIFSGFQILRVRRHVLEYGTRSGVPADAVASDEAADAADDAAEIIDAAERLLPNLGIFQKR